MSTAPSTRSSRSRVLALGPVELHLEAASPDVERVDSIFEAAHLHQQQSVVVPNPAWLIRCAQLQRFLEGTFGLGQCFARHVGQRQPFLGGRIAGVELNR